MHLKSLFSFIFLLFVAANQGFTQNYSGPESVEYYVDSSVYYVANPGNGTILKRSANGTLTVFASVSGGPYGIEIVEDTLYACSGGSIKAYQLPQGGLIYTAPVGGSFLNGITHDPSGNLYITDYSGNKIYYLNTHTRQSSLFIANTVHQPNGIIYDPYDGINPRLVFACWGSSARVRQINLNDSSNTLLTTTTCTNIDGIAKGRNGLFFLACWSNDAILQYDSTFTGGAQTVVTGLSNPADIYYNFHTDTLAVPNSGQSTPGGANNTVTFHHWPFVITGSKDVDEKFDLRLIFSQGLLCNETSNDLSMLQVFDASGRCMFTGPLNAGQRLSLPNVAHGIYLCKATLKSGETISRKIHIP